MAQALLVSGVKHALCAPNSGHADTWWSTCLCLCSRQIITPASFSQRWSSCVSLSYWRLASWRCDGILAFEMFSEESELQALWAVFMNSDPADTSWIMPMDISVCCAAEMIVFSTQSQTQSLCVDTTTSKGITNVSSDSLGLSPHNFDGFYGFYWTAAAQGHWQQGCAAMIISPEAEEHVVLGEGNSNPHTEAAIASLLILRELIWGAVQKARWKGSFLQVWQWWEAAGGQGGCIHNMWRCEAWG